MIRRPHVRLFLILLLPPILVGGGLWQQERALRPLPQLEARIGREDGPLRLAIFGDSWASAQKMNAPIGAAFQRRGTTVAVRSVGMPGATSREIYDHLLADREGPLWSEWKPDICVIFAGINDSASHLGREQYAHHLKCLSLALVQRGVVPAIVEIPEYGIEAMKCGPLVSAKHFIFRHLFDDGETNPLPHYRAAGEQALATLPAMTYYLLDTSSLPPEAFSGDHVHPTADGYSALGEILVSQLW